MLDDGVIWLGAPPATFTGEPTAELTVHGNPLIVSQILDAAVSAGARLAGPGEFTRRALERGKLDLVAAEGILQVAGASSVAGLRVARAGMDGRLAAAYDEMAASLRGVAAELEARLDHPGDELTYEDDDGLLASLADVSERARALADSQRAGQTWVSGARVALVGAVNAGKSTLFNQLVGSERALVHESPGTTRDVVEARVELGGLAITLLDTAGERDAVDPVEAAGLALARRMTADVDLLVVVLRARPGGPDPTEVELLARTAGRPRLVVLNGVDREHGSVPGALQTVAIEGQGVLALAQAVRDALAGAEPAGHALVIASARQRDLLRTVAERVTEAGEALPFAGVAVAAELVMEALLELDALTGRDTREAVLDALFARFCIGK